MTPHPLPLEDLELLSAWLAGELDDAAAAALEARLRDDAALRRGAAALADALLALGDDRGVGPPPGFEQRLEARLDDEAGRALPWGAHTAGGDAGGGGHVVSLDAARDARSRRLGRITGVAAALLLIGGVGTVLVGGGLSGGFGAGEDAADEAAVVDDGGGRLEAPAPAGGVSLEAATAAATDAELPAAGEDAADGGADRASAAATAAGDAGFAGDAAAEEAAAEGPATPAPTPSGPVIDVAAGLPDEDAVRARYAGRPEVAAFLGRDAADVTALGRGYADAIRRAEPFPDGTAPAACLDDVLRDAPGAAVATTVERTTFAGEPVLAYVVVIVGEGSPTADRAEVWIVDDACAVRAFLRLE